mmetsp:Transcript_1078/g.2626  ORF Transcript_1078/g.2626 Transcript_1078/m.2626 type:complete len:390 (+) Transcript_1078:2257-3426(+)
MALDKLLYLEFLVLGCGILIGWNAILTAIDWFVLNPSFLLPVFNFSSCPIFQVAATSKGHLISFNKRVVGCMLLIACILAVIPIVAATVKGLLGFAIVSVLVFFNGAVNAVAQTTVYGMAGMMPGDYTQAVMLGNSLSGIVLSAARMVCLVTFSTSSSGLQMGTTVYFLLSGTILVLCCFAQVHITKHPLVKQNVLSKYTPTQQPFLPDGAKLNIPEASAESEISYRKLLGSMWGYATLVFINFFITCAIFPAVAITATVSGLNYSWFVVLMVMTYYTSDLIGRQVVSYYMLKPRLLAVLTCMRFLFWVTTLLIAVQEPPQAVFSAPWFIFSNTALLAFTNGYYCTQHMIYGPSQVEGVLKDKAGNVMSFALSLGIGLGSFMSLAFVGV